ncbi:unnamed protein product [Symbiodinium natans]|uniref:Uncharacterized protein n=1 Tax=Symbiodinium natans TaxID=878477 RepID=A0A812MDQ6_9DINO|nr:unnamed protein product [Symbiodinium natans]
MLVDFRRRALAVVVHEMQRLPGLLGQLFQAGTHLAALRYGALDGRLGRGVVDIVDGDIDLELLLPTQAFEEGQDLALLKRLGAQLEGVDMANWTAGSFRAGLFSRMGRRPILRRRPGLWRSTSAGTTMDSARYCTSSRFALSGRKKSESTTGWGTPAMAICASCARRPPQAQAPRSASPRRRCCPCAGASLAASACPGRRMRSTSSRATCAIGSVNGTSNGSAWRCPSKT